MNSERTLAYGRVMKELADLSENKLHPSEQQVVREAADALIFCESLAEDSEAEKAVADLYELTDGLVESERMSSEHAIELTRDVEACGPLAVVR